jgi:hypothetical protein
MPVHLRQNMNLKYFEKYYLLGCDALYYDKNRSFKGIYCVHLQGRRVSQARYGKRKAEIPRR